MYRLVIVEDEIKILRGIVETFPWGQWGYSIAGSFTHSMKALEFIRKHEVDVVLTDVYMPSLNGIELTKKIKESHSDIDVVFISGFRDFEFAKCAVELGVKQYITKPISYHEIKNTFARIRSKLDEQRQARPLNVRDFAEQKLTSRTHNEKIIEMVEEYIANHIESASLTEAANLVGLSEGHLSKIFKRIKGRSFSDYLIDVKMERALILLDDVKLRIFEIAYLVGYQNPKNFTRQFRKYFGVSPNEYRAGVDNHEKKVFH